MAEVKQRIIVIHNHTCPSINYVRFGPCDCPGKAIETALLGIANVEPLPNLLAYLDRFLLHLNETGEYDNDLLSAIVVTLMQMGRDPNTAVNAPQVDPTGGFTATGGRVGPDGLPPQAEKLYDAVRGQTDRCAMCGEVKS